MDRQAYTKAEEILRRVVEAQQRAIWTSPQEMARTKERLKMALLRQGKAAEVAALPNDVQDSGS